MPVIKQFNELLIKACQVLVMKQSNARPGAKLKPEHQRVFQKTVTNQATN